MALANEAHDILKQLPEPGYFNGPWFPFFLPANVDQVVEKELTAATVHAAFRGTLQPWLHIEVNLQNRDGWSIFQQLAIVASTRAKERAANAVWRSLMKWFKEHKEFRQSVFIRMENNFLGARGLWLVLGQTKAGSLVGVASVAASQVKVQDDAAEVHKKLLAYERESAKEFLEPKTKRVKARGIFRIVNPADYSAVEEGMSETVDKLKYNLRAAYTRAQFSKLKASASATLTPSWATVHRCLTAGRFVTDCVEPVLRNIYLAYRYGYPDDTGDLLFVTAPEQVAQTAQQLASVDEEWLKARYHDLRATDYAPQMKKADWQATLVAFEQTKALFAQAAAENGMIVFEITSRTDEERAAEIALSLTPPAKPNLGTVSADGLVHDCTLHDDFLKPLLPCMDDYGETSKKNEWEHNSVSPKTVRYSCGCLARQGETLVHAHEPAELERCRQLADKAADLLKAVAAAHDQGGLFLPFYITANAGDPVPKEITEEYIRTVFRGTLCPTNAFRTEPQNDQGSWWSGHVTNHWIPEEQAVFAKAWKAFIKWFAKEPGLHAHSFVMVGLGDDDAGPCHPRLAVALTDKGSLVGVCGHVIYA